jgi:hypothetical protein
MKKGNGKKKAKGVEAKAKVTRIDAAVAAIKGGPMTKEKWIEATDKAYSKAGGVSNVKESAWAIRHTLAVLKALGCIEKKEDRTLALKK